MGVIVRMSGGCWVPISVGLVVPVFVFVRTFWKILAIIDQRMSLETSGPRTHVGQPPGISPACGLCISRCTVPLLYDTKGKSRSCPACRCGMSEYKRVRSHTCMGMYKGGPLVRAIRVMKLGQCGHPLTVLYTALRITHCRMLLLSRWAGQHLRGFTARYALAGEWTERSRHRGSVSRFLDCC